MAGGPILTPADLGALPEGSTIRDKHGDVGVIRRGYVHYPETAPLTFAYVAGHYLPATCMAPQT